MAKGRGTQQIDEYNEYSIEIHGLVTLAMIFHGFPANL